jgi:PIN domain nuclease of toxin-antitoxin system
VTPVTAPDIELTETEELAEVQVPPKTPSERLIVEATQTADGPVIAVGVFATVIVFVAKHPVLSM